MAVSLFRKLSQAARRNELAWRYTFNLGPALKFRIARSGLSAEAARVVRDLNRQGIALTSAEELFGECGLFGELQSAVAGLEQTLSGQLHEARQAAGDLLTGREKAFLYELLGPRPTLDPGSIFARFALSRPILQIANAYFGMYTRLRYYNVWHTFVTSGQPRQSQLWHRDREDQLILKLFVYLDDVDLEAGPLTYAPGTHLKGAIRQTPECFKENGVWRSTDQQMAAVVPCERWITAVGRKGTIVFADTHGYHKGGLARGRDRILYTCMFTSPASESAELLSRPKTLPLPAEKDLAFALSAPKRGPLAAWRPRG